MQYMNYKMIEPLLAKLGGGKGSDYTEEQALAIQQESLGRGLALARRINGIKTRKTMPGCWRMA